MSALLSSEFAGKILPSRQRVGGGDRTRVIGATIRRLLSCDPLGYAHSVALQAMETVRIELTASILRGCLARP